MQYNWLKYFVLFYEIRFFTFDYKTTLHKKNLFEVSRLVRLSALGVVFV